MPCARHHSEVIPNASWGLSTLGAQIVKLVWNYLAQQCSWSENVIEAHARLNSAIGACLILMQSQKKKDDRTSFGFSFKKTQCPSVDSPLLSTSSHSSMSLQTGRLSEAPIFSSCRNRADKFMSSQGYNRSCKTQPCIGTKQQPFQELVFTGCWFAAEPTCTTDTGCHCK